MEEVAEVSMEDESVESPLKRVRRAPRKFAEEADDPRPKKRGRKKKKKPEGKKKKAKKGEEPMKKPKTAYMMFFAERRATVKGLEAKEARRVMSERWKALEKGDKEPYEAQAAALKDAWAAAEAARIAKEEEAFRKQEELKARRKAAAEAAKRKREEAQEEKRTRPRIPAEGFWTQAPDMCEQREWVYRSHARHPARRVASIDYCDDQCTVCMEGGSLIVCSSCPRAFHAKCLKDQFVDAPEEVKGDLGGRNYKRRGGEKRQGSHRPDPRAVVVGAKKDKDDDAWHCPVCSRSHTEACPSCGEAGDDETRLVPCSKCPRAFHFRCAALVMAPEGPIVWICPACRPPDKASPMVESDKEPLLREALQDETLEKIANLCATLPRHHFASIFGSRLERVRDLARTVESRGSDLTRRSLGAIDCAHDVDSVASRLHFAIETNDEESKRSFPMSLASRAWDARGDNADDVARRRFHFAVDGLCVLPGALDAARVEAARNLADTYYEDSMHTVCQLNLEDTLHQSGFATLKARDRGRFDLVVPAFTRDYDFLRPENCPWLPLVRALIGDQVRLCHVGVIVALSDSAQQKWHSDGDHVHADLQLPPHALNVFLPLVDVTAKNGATEFAPGSHLDWNTAEKVVIDAQAGDAIIFDWRLKHRGLSNQITQPRPLLYLTYALPWFVDCYNFSSDRYEELPPLVPRTSRADRAMRRW